MKTATLTFHASHNYGSMLQAYALQQVMTKIFGHNEIINFRSQKQKRMMRVLSFRPGVGPMLKDISHLFFYNSLKRKHCLFEQFITDHMALSLKELPAVTSDDMVGYDLVCCGSDQIWNPWPEDFDMTYLLPFDFSGKKISYAASMGPGRDIWPSEKIDKFPSLLKDFNGLSVRESGTRQTIESLTNIHNVYVHCDPVFLLEKEEWTRLIDPERLIKDEYIFFYTLFANKKMIGMAKSLSAKYRLPVVISNFTNPYDLFSGFRKKLKTGPREFLNLMSNAKMILTSSFHGTAFSILLNLPFAVVDGMNDKRISNLLAMCGLENRSVSNSEKLTSIGWDIDFSIADKRLTEERRRSVEYLKSFIG